MKADSYTPMEIRSGFLVVASLIFLLVLLFMAGSSQLFQETRDFHILFHYISGLAEDAPVHFAGHEVGKVTRISFSGGEEPKVKVTIRVLEDAVLRENTQAFINILGFMGESYIELTPGGPGATALEPGATIVGNDPIPMMEIVKQAREVTEEFEKTATALNGLLDQTQGILQTNENDVNEIFSNLNVATGNLRAMTQDLKKHPWKLLHKEED